MYDYCDNEYPSLKYQSKIHDLTKKVTFLESALYIVINGLRECDKQLDLVSFPDYFRWVDFKDSGITRKELEDWYSLNYNLKEVNKINEQKRKDTIRKIALMKLTAEEKEILGI